MNSEWMTFLEGRGARIDDGRVTGFADAPNGPAAILCDLSHLGLLAVAGEDAKTFLQGQITNDIREVDACCSRYGSLCSPKGRMLASFLAFQRDDTVYLQMPRENLAPIHKRLQMFVLRSKVTLADASDDLLRIGVAGSGTQDALAAVAGDLPEIANAAISTNGLTVIRLPGEQRFEVIAPQATMQGIWDKLAGPLSPAGAAAWALSDIEAGVPNVYANTAEAFVPQMANLQLLGGGVSFTKGCYTGQEIVARMQYLGKLKRRMYRAHLDADAPPAPGDELYAHGSASGQGTGKIVDAQPSPTGGYEVLAVVEIAAAEQGDVRLGGADGPELEFKPLPYAFEQAAEE